MESRDEIGARHLTEAHNKQLKRETDRAYWLGIALGLVAGLMLVGLAGYNLGSDNTVIIPLEQGTKL